MSDLAPLVQEIRDNTPRGGVFIDPVQIGYGDLSSQLSPSIDYSKYLTDGQNLPTSPYLQALNKEYQHFSARQEIDVEKNYTRLNDGSYIPKTENFLGNYNNEDRLAQQQSAGEQWFNGLTKMVGKIGTYALDNTVGTVYGLINGIAEGSWEATWDNDFSKWLDDVNTEMDNGLPNYYSNAQHNMGVFQQMGTANFWANDVTGGLAFVGGVILPEAALALVTRGGSLSTAIPRVGFKLGTKLGIKAATKGAKAAAKAGGKAALKQSEKILAKNAKNLYRQTTLGKIGEGLDTGLFAFRSSHFEAGMEARHNHKEALESYIRNFEAIYGRQPTPEEFKAFAQQAVHTANGVYSANLAILAPSNLIMFGKTLGLGVATSKAFNNFTNKTFFGVGTKSVREGGKIVEKALESTRAQRYLNRGTRLFGKASVEGLYEEGFQGVAGKTMQNYLQAKYDPEFAAENASFTQALTNAFHEQYTTTEGWKEMTIGMIIGGLGGNAFKPVQLVKGVGNNFTLADTKQQVKDQVERSQQGHDSIYRRFSALTGLKVASKKQTENTEGTAEWGVDIGKAVENEKQSSWHYINTMPDSKSDEEIIDDYDYHVDNMEISKEVMNEYNMTPESVADYKSQLKEKFRKDITDARRAKQAVKTFGITKDLTIGNKREIEDTLAYTVYMGENSLTMAREAAEQLEQATNSSGLLNVLNFMNNLSKESNNLLNQIDSNNSKIEKNEKIVRNLVDRITTKQQALAEKTNRRGAPQMEKKIQKDQSELTALNKKLTELKKSNEILEQENERAKEILGKEYESSNFDLTEDFTLDETGGAFTMDGILEKIQKLEELSTDLRKVGKNDSALQIERLLAEFSHHNNNYVAFKSLMNDMSDPEFFRSKRGRKIFKNIIGKTYKMSDEFEKLIEENKELIASSLQLNGRTDILTDNIVDYVKSIFDDNSNISEREKFRNEVLIRTVLMHHGVASAQVQSEAIIAGRASITTEEGDLGNPDAISERVSRKIKQQEELVADKVQSLLQSEALENLDNLDQVKALIAAMIQNVNSLFETIKVPKTSLTKQEISAIEKEFNVTITEENGEYSVEAKPVEVKEADPVTSTKDIKQLFEEVSKLPYNERIPALLEAGVISSDQYLQTGNRYVIFVNINGVSVPFYRSSGGTSGKKLGGWYAFFGIGEQLDPKTGEKEEGWLIKGSLEELEEGYGIPAIKEMQELLDSTLNWSTTDISSHKSHSTSGLSPIKSFKSFNETLHGKEDLDTTNGINAQERVSEFIEEFKTKIGTELNKLEEAEVEATPEVDTEAIQKEAVEKAKAKIAENLEGEEVAPYVISPEQVKRLDDLLKRDYESLSLEERQELSDLKMMFNNWSLVDSTVVDNIGLGDLLEIKNQYETIEINEDRDVYDLQEFDVIPPELLNERSTKNFNHLLQSYFAVTLAREGDKVSIQNINMEGLVEVMGEGITSMTDYDAFQPGTTHVIDIAGKAVEIEINDRGNLLLNQEDVAFLNDNTNLIIKPLKTSPSNYSVLLTRDADGVRPVYSNFGVVEENSESLIYNLKPDESLEVFVDPTDEYNKKLVASVNKETIRKKKATRKEIAKRLSEDKQAKKISNQISKLDGRKKEDKAKKKELQERLKNINRTIEENVVEEMYLEAVREEVVKVADDLLIRVGKGNITLGVLKAAHRERTNDATFIEIRKRVAENYAQQIVGLDTQPILISELSPRVVKVYPGHANFLYEETEDGDLITRYQPFTKENTKNIVDIGYYQNGKTVTRRGKEVSDAVNKDFLKSIGVNPSKVPIVVINHSGMDIAYPVQLLTTDVEAVKERVENIFNLKDISEDEESGVTKTQKILAINEALAEVGIDPKETGASFKYFTAENNNLTEENLQSLLGLIENNKYLYREEMWMGDMAISEVLNTQAVINIDMSTPFHSPKIAVDYGDNFKPDETIIKKNSKKTKGRDTDKDTSDLNKNLRDIACKL